MALFVINNVSIKGISSCVPKRTEDNHLISLFNKEEASKFIQSTGIQRRRVADESITTSDLCHCAAEKLISDLGWGKDTIECLVFVTQTPDYILPATSCILQERLGLSTETYAIDISLGCSGWIYGLSSLAQFLSCSGMKRGLLLTGDTISKLVSTKDKSTCPLFGDAGTATALQFDTVSSPFIFHLATDGSGFESIIVPDGEGRNPISETSSIYKQYGEGVIRNDMQLSLNGMDVFSFGISKAPQSVNKLLEFASLERECIDYFLFHQANFFMNEKIRRKLKLTEKQVPYSLKDFGNTSSASIPLTMNTQLREQLTTQKLKNIACGFGVGLSWGTVYFETDKIVCPQLIEI